MSKTTRNAAVGTTQVMDALDEVLDPCSCQTENPVSIVELGLVQEEEVSVSDGVAHVHVTPTTPMCMYMLQMTEEIEKRLTALPGIEDVNVTQEKDEPFAWTPDRMTEEALAEREARFESRVEQGDIEPYDWSEQE
jgi:ATP-binding protein involved in chromosome partitioning